MHAGGAAATSGNHAIYSSSARHGPHRSERYGGVCEWKRPRAPTIRLLFQDERATPVVLAFLRGTKAWRMVILAPLEKEWQGLEEIVLWSEEAESQDENEEEGGSGPP